MSQTPSRQPFLLSTAIVALLALMVAGVVKLSHPETSGEISDGAPIADTTPVPALTPSASTPSDTAPPTATTTPTPTATTTYKNGSYSATGNYNTPGGRESITVNLTVSNDVVTTVSVSLSGIDDTSREYQSAFANGYKQYVVGKKIDAISLSRVSGSSLTSGGFNAALATIKAQARS